VNIRDLILWTLGEVAASELANKVYTFLDRINSLLSLDVSARKSPASLESTKSDIVWLTFY
jgi:hypothetical protein